MLCRGIARSRLYSEGYEWATKMTMGAMAMAYGKGRRRKEGKKRET